MSFSHTGSRFPLPAGAADFARHLETYHPREWAKGVTLHHTASPSLAMRPKGLLMEHIENIRDFYKNKLGWHRGPHLFVDDHGVYCMTPLNERGTHAVSFNGTHVAIEVLGNYDTELPDSGRGLQCWKNAARVLVMLGFSDKFNFHRDDPETDKTCPGSLITKLFVAARVTDAIAAMEWEKAAAAIDREKAGSSVTDATPKRDQEPHPLVRGLPDVLRGNGGVLLAPIADTLKRMGKDGSYDSGNWKDVDVLHYDAKREISYGSLWQILDLHETH